MEKNARLEREVKNLSRINKSLEDENRGLENNVSDIRRLIVCGTTTIR
jgi:hypothetical protein